MSHSIISFDKVKTNQEVEICNLIGPNCDKLKNMGFCENIKICKFLENKNIVCTICGTKIAISSELAKEILVKNIDKL